MLRLWLNVLRETYNDEELLSCKCSDFVVIFNLKFFLQLDLRKKLEFGYAIHCAKIYWYCVKKTIYLLLAPKMIEKWTYLLKIGNNEYDYEHLHIYFLQNDQMSLRTMAQQVIAGTTGTEHDKTLPSSHAPIDGLSEWKIFLLIFTFYRNEISLKRFIFIVNTFH